MAKNRNTKWRLLGSGLKGDELRGLMNVGVHLKGCPCEVNNPANKVVNEGDEFRGGTLEVHSGARHSGE